MTISINSNTHTTGTNVCATPIASIDINVGYVPEWVRVFNPANDCKMEWFYGMAAGTGIFTPTVKNGVLTTPGCAMGSTKDQVANIAFNFGIAGIGYSKAATAAGTAPTATTIPQNKWGLFGFEIGADGTIDKKDAANNAAGYASEALALAALPAASADHVLFMYVTVMCTEAAGFVGATTEFDAVGVTAHFYNVASVVNPQTLGITTVDDDDCRGFRIGAHTSLQVAGQTLYWECGRGVVGG